MISDTLLAWHEDDSVRVVVLTGAPPAFSAGFDLGEFQDTDARAHDPAQLGPLLPSGRMVVPEGRRSRPSTGTRWGGGSTSRRSATCGWPRPRRYFGHPEIKFGAPPLFTLLRWLVGDGIARDLCLTGRRIDSQEALRIGLVSRVVAAGALIEEAVTIARQIAEAPQRTLQATKRYLAGNQGFGIEDSFRSTRRRVRQLPRRRDRERAG